MHTASQLACVAHATQVKLVRERRHVQDWQVHAGQGPRCHKFWLAKSGSALQCSIVQCRPGPFTTARAPHAPGWHTHDGEGGGGRLRGPEEQNRGQAALWDPAVNSEQISDV